MSKDRKQSISLPFVKKIYVKTNQVVSEHEFKVFMPTSGIKAWISCSIVGICLLRIGFLIQDLINHIVILKFNGS